MPLDAKRWVRKVPQMRCADAKVPGAVQKCEGCAHTCVRCSGAGAREHARRAPHRCTCASAPVYLRTRAWYLHARALLSPCVIHCTSRSPRSFHTRAPGLHVAPTRRIIWVCRHRDGRCNGADFAPKSAWFEPRLGLAQLVRRSFSDGGSRAVRIPNNAQFRCNPEDRVSPLARH
jgi:hypothetical protein